jgi:hypothetical protein
LKRKRNGFVSTLPSEIVTCRLDDGRRRRLFCKYGPAVSPSEDGLIGGIDYEADVYRHVLGPARVSAPVLLGTFPIPATNRVGIVIEFVYGGQQVGFFPKAMTLAAAWVARFHSAHERPDASRPKSPIAVYDENYYLGCVQRLDRRMRHWTKRPSWLPALCDRAREWVALLLDPPLTVIHGEYYPPNILLRRGKIFTVDWESAAIAAGEIDLACLTEAWAAPTVRSCVRHYCSARWPAGAPDVFDRRLAAARLYLACRWLAVDGGRAEYASPWYVRSMRSAGIRLGLIDAPLQTQPTRPAGARRA